MNKSPLRYPGGKTRACKKLGSIVEEYFYTDKIKKVVSPFFGGGSFEFYLQEKYNCSIIANDKFTPVYSFWETCKNNKKKLCKKLNKKINISKEQFMTIRKSIMQEEEFNQAVQYFIINRCSFSGATLSGGFSEEASKKRFTKSSINRVSDLDLSNVEFHNQDFSTFIDSIKPSNKILLFLDPPYYLENSKLYGNNGDLHTFDHNALFDIMKETKMCWIMTYNDHPKIRKMYQNYTILDINWSYGMNKTKKSSEIVILGP